MKSSHGEYYIALDHIRALAVFIVFTWHFLHFENGHLAPAPIFPLSILTEGHVGVSLFMCLSGYLFNKLLDGKKIDYAAFIRNRVLRLAPLLLVVIFLFGIINYRSGDYLELYVKSILMGVLKPTLPNGGWSITIEFHFYLILPFLLYLGRKSSGLIILLLGFIIIVRGLLYNEFGSVQEISYWTIIGRLDQFILGILAYQYRKHISGKHAFAIIVIFLFLVFYWYFDKLGGFYTFSTYPSTSSIWVFLPTIEAFCFAIFIAWYDNSFKSPTGRISRFIALIGNYSYSIYLLHFFVVFQMPVFINDYVFEISNIYVGMLCSAFCFLLMVPIGHASFVIIESPFLRLRTKYILTDEVTEKMMNTEK